MTHANKCHCQCRQVAGAPSRPGAVQCQFAVRITREGSPSCNGQNVLEVAGDRCIQITSEAFAVRLQNADLTGATIDVGPLQGNPPMCRPRDEARSGTAVTRGGSITFEAAGGDMAVPMTVTCVTACGDGVLDPGEDCDDGGLVSGDGCDDRCRIEPPGPRGSHTCTLDTAAQCQGGDRDGLPCIDTATHGDCPPGPSGGARCLAESRLELHSRTAQPLLTAPVRGSVRIDCDAFDPLTGTSPCACAIEQLDPVDLGPFLGIACFEPLAGCDEGTLDCDGGQPRDAETIAAHSIGSCGLADPVAGPAECRAACDAHCAALGDGFARIQSACEGSCRGGSRADQVCSFDFECPGGECPGGDPVAHANRCQCECERSGGRPASPGALTCPLGLRIRLETALPCDGEDVRAERRVCTRLTTEQASGEIRNADVFGVTVAADARGQAAGCATLSAGALGPTTLAGHLALFDSTHGDLVAPLRLACE